MWQFTPKSVEYSENSQYELLTKCSQCMDPLNNVQQVKNIRGIVNVLRIFSWTTNSFKTSSKICSGFHSQMYQLALQSLLIEHCAFFRFILCMSSWCERRI